MRPSVFLRSTIGHKFLVAATGLAFAGFLVTHMAGNLLLLVSGDAYNQYSHALVSNPLLPIAEIGLVVIIVLHFTVALRLNWNNRKARPVKPVQLPAPATKKRSNLLSRTMVLSGCLTLAFLVLHLWTFKYGNHYSTVVGGVEMRDIYRLVVEKFHEPLYVAWYVFALVLLGGHLNHGIAATAQSLGFTGMNRPKWQTFATVAAWTLIFGFIIQPLFIYGGFSFGGGH